MTKHLLSVLAFIIVSFAVQGPNHFVINKAHYDEIEFARAEPVMALGILTMIIQGIILTFAMTKITSAGALLNDGLLVSLSFGLFLAVYIALAEPAKYAAPSIPSWFMTEGLVSTIQFVVFGVALGLIHRKFAMPS
jgi:hypothetical protein